MWLEFLADRAGDLVGAWRRARRIGRVFLKRLVEAFPGLVVATLIAVPSLSVLFWWRHVWRLWGEIFQVCGIGLGIASALIFAVIFMRGLRHGSSWPQRATDRLQGRLEFSQRLYWHNVCAAGRHLRSIFLLRVSRRAEPSSRAGGSVTHNHTDGHDRFQTGQMFRDDYRPISVCGVKIPRKLEYYHGLVIGSDPVQREVVFDQILEQVLGRDDDAIVLDVAPNLRRHYRAGRDVIVDPSDVRSVGLDLDCCFQTGAFDRVLKAMVGPLPGFTAEEKDDGVGLLLDAYPAWRRQQIASAKPTDLEAILSFHSIDHEVVAACLREPKLVRIWGPQETRQTQRLRSVIFDLLAPFAGFLGLSSADFSVPCVPLGASRPGAVLYLGLAGDGRPLDEFFKWLAGWQLQDEVEFGRGVRSRFLLQPHLAGKLNLCPERIEALRGQTRRFVATFLGIEPKALASGEVPVDAYCTRVVLEGIQYPSCAVDWMGRGAWLAFDDELQHVAKQRLLVTDEELAQLRPGEGLIHFHSNTRVYGSGRVRLSVAKPSGLRPSFTRIPPRPAPWEPGLFDAMPPAPKLPAPKTPAADRIVAASLPLDLHQATPVATPLSARPSDPSEQSPLPAPPAMEEIKQPGKRTSAVEELLARRLGRPVR